MTLLHRALSTKAARPIQPFSPRPKKNRGADPLSPPRLHRRFPVGRQRLAEQGVAGEEAGVERDPI
jgi:hypothetical protein